MFFVVGQIFKEKELVGYRILELTRKEVVDIALDRLRKICSSNNKKVTFINAKYKPDTGILVGTQGSLTEYQALYTNGVLAGKKRLAVCYKILDVDTGKLGGYGVCDGYGMLVNIKIPKLVSLCSKYEMSNFTLEQDKRGNFEVRSRGDDFISVKMQVIEAKKGYNSKLGEVDDGRKVNVCSEVKDSKSSVMLPAIQVYSYDDLNNNDFGLSAQDKMFKAYINMKKLSPYYHTILMSIKREVTTAVETMGVNETTMYYNPQFVDSLSVGEITFVLIHEVCHIAMRHSYRHGNKHNVLWNIACDLYINSIISRDFDCHFGGKEMEIETSLGKAYIKVPSSGIHLSTIGETLDFGVDTAESIYAKLLKENPQLKKMSSGASGQQQGQNSGQSQSSSQSQEQEQGQGQGQSSGQDSGQSQSSGQNSGQGQSSSQSQEQEQGQGQGQSNEQSDDLMKEGQLVDNDRSSLEDEGTEIDQSGIYDKEIEVTVTYNGKKLTGKMSMDVTTSEIGDSKDRNERMKEKSLTTIQGMKTAVEVQESKTGEKLVKNAGAGAGLVQRCIEFGLSTLVDWRVLLKNMCKSKPKKMYTMASPNEVYMNAGVTVASRRKIGKPTEISGIKVCIDVSGSITERELTYYLSEVNSILSKFKVNGELIYWSTMVGDAGDFSDLQGLLKVKPKSSGGTDVKCVFDYLSGKTRVNGQFEPTRIRDISCVLIFTDGCFSNNYEQYASYFGKKVIWVIPSSKFMFKPPFGKIACLD